MHSFHFTMRDGCCLLSSWVHSHSYMSKYYLQFVEVLFELLERFLERIDRGAGSWSPLTREDDLLLVD